jgi:hypothetical protein
MRPPVHPRLSTDLSAGGRRGGVIARMERVTLRMSISEKALTSAMYSP